MLMLDCNRIDIVIVTIIVTVAASTNNRIIFLMLCVLVVHFLVFRFNLSITQISEA